MHAHELPVVSSQALVLLPLKSLADLDACSQTLKVHSRQLFPNPESDMLLVRVSAKEGMSSPLHDLT